VPLEVRQLIRDMSLANPLWGAPRIHGELLKLGIDAQWTSEIDRCRRGHRGKMGTRNVSSADPKGMR